MYGGGTLEIVFIKFGWKSLLSTDVAVKLE